MDKVISRRKFLRGSASGLGAAATIAVLGGTAFATTQLGSDGRSPGHSPDPERSDDRKYEVLEELRADVREKERRAALEQSLRQLISPIAIDTILGSVRVAAISLDARGVGLVTLEDERGRRSDAELCRRSLEDAGLRPLVVSRHYSLYLRNRGDGSVPTDENVGRAVLALGHRVKRNEGSVALLALPSRKEVWASTGHAGGTAKG